MTVVEVDGSTEVEVTGVGVGVTGFESQVGCGLT